MSAAQVSNTPQNPQHPDAALREQLGVTSGSFQRYRDDCRMQLGRLREAKAALADRNMHGMLERVDATLAAIISNITQDPDDIREEIALPSVMSRLADTLEEYLRLASTPSRPARTEARLHDIAALTNEGARWLERLLERMKANDGDGVLARVQVLSALFRNDEQHRRDGRL